MEPHFDMFWKQIEIKLTSILGIFDRLVCKCNTKIGASQQRERESGGGGGAEAIFRHQSRNYGTHKKKCLKAFANREESAQSDHLRI